jgi:outer membrane receptor for ferrienterochelin and colicins
MSRNFAVMKRSHSAGQAMLGFFLATTALSAPALAQTAPKADKSTVLEQIVVTASGFEQNVKDAPASITVVTSEELAKGSFRDLTDALSEVQGVAVTGIAKERDIFIRGLPGSYTLILVDGKRQNTREARTNGNSGFEQSFIPPVSAIDRIEVVRGPMSSLYGSDAMGGVINVITKKVGDKWSGSVTTEGTLQQHSEFKNSGQVSWYANGPILKDQLGLQVWGRGFKRGEDAIFNGEAASKDYDLSGRFTYTPNADHDIYLSGGKTRVLRDALMGVSVDPKANGAADSHSAHIRKNWSIAHTGRWGPTTSEFSLQQEWAVKDNLGGINEPRIRNTVLDGKFTTPFELLGDNTLTTGGQYNHARLSSTNPGQSATVMKTFSTYQWAIFAENEWRPVENFALTGGIRLDQHETYGTHYSPRLYGVWTVTPDFTVKGGVSTGFRAPEIRTVAPGFAYTTEKGKGVILSNENLRPETSTNYEISGLWDNGEMSFGATYFYTDFSDKISNEKTTRTWLNSSLKSYNLWEYFNIDGAVLQGVELTSSWQATADINLRASYTYADSEQQTGDYAGFPLTRTPEHMANIRADWMTPVEGLQAWASVNYHGEEINSGARIGTNGTPVIVNGKTGYKYDAYATLDLGANYALNETVDFKAAVYNVFDKEIAEKEFNTVGEGRRFWVSMTANF